MQHGDALLIVADEEAAIAETAAAFGRLEPGRIAKDRGDLSYQRFFVSKANVTGVRLADLPIPPSVSIQVLHVRRYDVDLVPAPELMLEIGDRVGVIVPTEHIADARALFGDTVKSAAEFSYVSVGFGMVLGVLLGLIPIPLPGIGTVTLGIGGGPLLVALIVGRLRRTGPISWVMPLPANIVLRNFGLTLFLATVGINSGQAFVTTVAQTGPLMLLIGAAVLLTTVAIVLLVGHYLFRIPFDDLLGVASGATGNPAILVYATRMAPTERPDIGYAMIFPSATIVKVIAVQIIGLILLGTEPVAGESASARFGGHRGAAAAGDRRKGRGRWCRQGRTGCDHAAVSRRSRWQLHCVRRDLCNRRAHRGGGRTAVRYRARGGRAGLRPWVQPVLIGGAQIFTGDVLMVMAWASGGPDMQWNRWYVAKSYLYSALWIVPLVALLLENVVIRLVFVLHSGWIGYRGSARLLPAPQRR